MAKIKRILGVTLSALMMISMAACGKKDDISNAGNVEAEYDKSCVFSCEEINLGKASGNLVDIKECDGSLAVLYAKTNFVEDEPEADEAEAEIEADETKASESQADTGAVEEQADSEAVEPQADTEASESQATVDIAVEVPAVEDLSDMGSFVMTFMIYDMEGNSKKTVVKEYPTSMVDVIGYWVDADMNLYYVLDYYPTGDEINDTYELIKCDKDGNELWNTPLGENVTTDEWYYARLSCIHDGAVYVTDVRGVCKFNCEDGTLIQDYESEEIANSGGVFGILRDGTAFSAVYNGPDEASILSFDLDSLKVKGNLDIPFEPGMMDCYAGKTCDFVLSDNRGVYVCNIGDAEYKKIMDFVASDFEVTYIRSVIQIDDNSFMAGWYDDTDGVDKFGLFTKVNPEDIPDKKTIVVGMSYMDYDVRQSAVEFNKTNSEYRVLIKDYSQQIDQYGDYDKLLEIMNNDIISGNMPDIMLFDENLPVESYISKGLFEDLYTYIDNDDTYNRDFFVPNVLKATESNGKLYEFIPSFYVSTVVSKADTVGDKKSITMDELMSLMESKGTDVMDFGKLTKSEFMYQALRFNMDKFVDWETGEVSFDSDEFIKLLEYTERYPMEFNMDDESFWDGYETMYAEDRALFDIEGVNDFSRFISIKQGTFGNKDVRYIGFPTDSGMGSNIGSYMTFAVSSKSANKDAAWEFLKTFLSEQKQEKIGGFPVSKTALEKKLSMSKKLPTYIDDDGNEVEYHESYWIYDTEIELNPLSEEEAREAYEFVTSIDTMCSVDKNISDIVDEECASYYNKQKSAQDVAKIIQSRVQIYVNENS